MIESFVCPDCGIQLIASDWDSLAWGIGAHGCGPYQPEAGECFDEVVNFLCASYRRPFWLHRPGQTKVLVC